MPPPIVRLVAFALLIAFGAAPLEAQEDAPRWTQRISDLQERLSGVNAEIDLSEAATTRISEAYTKAIAHLEEGRAQAARSRELRAPGLEELGDPQEPTAAPREGASVEELQSAREALNAETQAYETELDELKDLIANWEERRASVTLSLIHI